MVLNNICHVLHATVTYLNVIPIKQLLILRFFGKCLSKSCENILPILVFMLKLSGGLNHKMFLLHFLLWGGCCVDLMFWLKPLFLSASLQSTSASSKHSSSHEVSNFLLLIIAGIFFMIDCGWFDCLWIYNLLLTFMCG